MSPKPTTTKTVLITGCSDGGIGSSLALAFQQQGLLVYATARQVSKMSKLAALPNVTLLALDVMSQESVDAAAKLVSTETGGKLNYLVNNAGVAGASPAIDVDIEKGKMIFDANFFGTVRMVKAFGPMVMGAKGSIVNICSTAGHMLPPWNGIYSASKIAQEAYSETLRQELAPYGVKVVSVIAGGVKTTMTQQLREPVVPAGALFKPTEKELARIRGNNARFPGALPDVFARKVVKDVLGGASGKIWRGMGASFVWFLMMLPRFVSDAFLRHVLGNPYELARA